MKQDNINTFIDEIYSKPPHKKYSTNKTVFKSIDDFWSIDITDLNDYCPEENRGYRFILVVVDKFSERLGQLHLKLKFHNP